MGKEAFVNPEGMLRNYVQKLEKLKSTKYSPEEADKLSLEKFPLQIGDREGGGTSGVIPTPGQQKVVYIPIPTYQKNRRKNQWGRNETNVIDPHGKGNAQLAYAS